MSMEHQCCSPGGATWRSHRMQAWFVGCWRRVAKHTRALPTPFPAHPHLPSCPSQTPRCRVPRARPGPPWSRPWGRREGAHAQGPPHGPSGGWVGEMGGGGSSAHEHELSSRAPIPLAHLISPVALLHCLIIFATNAPSGASRPPLSARPTSAGAPRHCPSECPWRLQAHDCV